jgi:hypothetical protein
MLHIAIAAALADAGEAQVKFFDVLVVAQRLGIPVEDDAAAFHDIAVVHRLQRHGCDWSRKHAAAPTPSDPPALGSGSFAAGGSRILVTLLQQEPPPLRAFLPEPWLWVPLLEASHVVVALKDHRHIAA